MTSTAKNEAPLTWSAKKVWGSVGGTYLAEVTLDTGETWKFVVDQPRKGYWTARGWRYEQGSKSGDMRFYREDKTMKGAKAQCQAHANYAATQTCTTCRDIGGHKLDCRGVLPVPAPAALTDVDEAAAPTTRANQGVRLMTDEAALTMSVMADRLTLTPRPLTDEGAQLIRGISAIRTAVTAMAPGIRSVDHSLRKMAHHLSRKCDCPTPLHTMRCGVGGRPVVVANHWSRLIDQVLDGECVDSNSDIWPEHNYNEVECTRCGAEAGA